MSKSTHYIDNRILLKIGAAVLLLLLVLIFGVMRVEAGETQSVTLDPAADSYVRWNGLYYNDNFGCNTFIEVGTYMWGMVQFDLSSLPAGAMITKATLYLTVYQHGTSDPNTTYTINVHRIVPTGALTPWIEGDGTFNPIPSIPQCVWVDPAYGVAWYGAGDGGDSNNQSHPNYDPVIAATRTYSQSQYPIGSAIDWNVTGLVQNWFNGTYPNYGFMIVEQGSVPWVRAERYGTRDAALHGIPDPYAVAGPKMIVEYEMPNTPPDCTGAFSNMTTLWPPHHTLYQIAVLGVTDADGDPITVTVNSVLQDEPVNGTGDGDTSPDAFINMNGVELRAERAGTGNGRFYGVNFTATDGKGGACTGTLIVRVPKNIKKLEDAFNDGMIYDSTLP